MRELPNPDNAIRSGTGAKPGVPADRKNETLKTPKTGRLEATARQSIAHRQLRPARSVRLKLPFLHCKRTGKPNANYQLPNFEVRGSGAAGNFGDETRYEKKSIQGYRGKQEQADTGD